MTGPKPSSGEQILDLMVDQALFGADDSESHEPELRVLGEAVDAMELAAGATAVVMLGPERWAPMPESAARRVRIAGAAWEAARSGHTVRGVSIAPVRSGPRVVVALPWFLAAACLGVLVLNWPSPVPRNGPPSVPSVSAWSDARTALIQSGGDVAVIPWTATDDPSAAGGVAGDVVWSDARNEGYMRISGLAANDPRQSQYQLWVFDAERDDRFPVDGGVFDIPAGGGDVIIPITAKVRVAEATLFAVTVEKPGGVVVSSRERLPILAKVGPS